MGGHSPTGGTARTRMRISCLENRRDMSLVKVSPMAAGGCSCARTLPPTYRPATGRLINKSFEIAIFMFIFLIYEVNAHPLISRDWSAPPTACGTPTHKLLHALLSAALQIEPSKGGVTSSMSVGHVSSAPENSRCIQIWAFLACTAGSGGRPAPASARQALRLHTCGVAR